jgi:hypothetical protein
MAAEAAAIPLYRLDTAFTLCNVDQLKASAAGLHVLAAHCGTVSAGLVTATPAPRVGLPIQATSPAVGSAYAALGAAAAVLAGRMEIYGANLGSAGTDFVTQEGTAAAGLDAVDQAIPT